MAYQSVLTISTLHQLVRNLISDNINFIPTSPGSISPQTYSDAQITDGLNYAIKVYCDRTRITYKKVSSSLSPVGEVTLPYDMLRVTNINYGNIALVQSSVGFEIMKNPSWELHTDYTPRRWVMYDGSTARITPYSPYWALAPYACDVFYQQMPPLLYSTSIESGGSLAAVPYGSLVSGQTYKIKTSGTGAFTSIGASSNSVGTVFVATGAGGSGTGDVDLCVDRRVLPAHQEYLKYPCAAYLLQMRGEAQSLELANVWHQTFFSLIGSM